MDNSATNTVYHDILKTYWGYDDFRSLQLDIITSVGEGRDTLGLMPTGGGKSITFQVPAMAMEGICIVVTPLIALMKDQVENLQKRGIRALSIYSGMQQHEIVTALDNCELGDYKFLYVSPERLGTELFLKRIQFLNVCMIVVDEAHCISQWGYDFRPAYLKIADLRKHIPDAPILALTATATPEVATDIQEQLLFKEKNLFKKSFERKNLVYVVRETEDKPSQLLTILRNVPGTAVVYVRSRKKTKEFSDFLNSNGISADYFHAGLENDDKDKKQAAWKEGSCRVIVATNAFGMGIDKSNVSFVIHYNMPKDIESYYQEAGRSGRDGEPAECVILYSGNDVRINRFMIENSREDNQELSDEQRSQMIAKDMERLKQMTFYCTTTDCLRGFMLKYFCEPNVHYCGKCSNCTDGFETVDITIDSQKILSCIYRIRQASGRDYGKSMLTDVLRGSQNEKLISLGFGELSTYGIMADSAPKKIRAEIDFLAEKGYIHVTEGDYPQLLLTARSAEVLKEKKPLTMKMPIEKKKVPSKAVGTGEDDFLFIELKKLRSTIAKKERVPAYIIFSDAALKDMCRLKPTDIPHFLRVAGVGKVKAEKYGLEFCTLIADHISKQAD